MKSDITNLLKEINWLLSKDSWLFDVIQTFEHLGIYEKSINWKRLKVSSWCLKKHFSKISRLFLLSLCFVIILNSWFFLLILLSLLSLLLWFFFCNNLCLCLGWTCTCWLGLYLWDRIWNDPRIQFLHKGKGWEKDVEEMRKNFAYVGIWGISQFLVEKMLDCSH